MKEKTIYRNVEGKVKILTLYFDFKFRLGTKLEEIYVEKD